MKTAKISGILAIISLLLACTTGKLPEDLHQEFPLTVPIWVQNSFPQVQKDLAVILHIDTLKSKAPDFNPKAFLVWSGHQELASQVIDADADGQSETIVVLADFNGGEKKQLRLHYSATGEKPRTYPRRTQAELSHRVGGQFRNRKYEGGTFQNVQFLRVPPEHTDHSNFIRYEGPGWESDKVGYRFYLDWRNAVDIFGKKVSDLVLQNVGQDGFDSYHDMADWGMDIFKFGNSLGLGSIGIWYQNGAVRVEKTDSITCAILASGPIYAQIRTRYFGWQVGAHKINLVSDLSIVAGSRLTRNHLLLEGDADNICTGLAKHANTHFLSQVPESATDWGYMALWGKQSLASADDELGIAVFYPGAQFIEQTQDSLNYVVVLEPEQNNVDYCFLAAWAQEPGGIGDLKAFEAYLENIRASLRLPVQVLYNN